MRGFSLLETLIYIGLFAVFMEGALTGYVVISESADRNQARAYLEEEGDFLLDKISYEVSQAVVENLSDKNTKINLISADSTLTSIQSLGDSLTITRGGSASVPFSSNLVSVSHLAFTASGTISFTLMTRSLSGQMISEDFSTVAYPHL